MKLTAQQFKEKIDTNPRWCATLTEPCEVTGYVNLAGSDIECLSPLLTFAGRSDEGWALDVSECPLLSLLSGTCHGAVVAHESAVRDVSGLTITKSDKGGWALDVTWCGNLQVLAGTFQGAVYAWRSGVRDISGLAVTCPDHDGRALDVSNCSNLELLAGTFPGAVDASHSAIRDVSGLIITTPCDDGWHLNVRNCESLGHVPLRCLRGWVIQAEPERIAAWRETAERELREKIAAGSTFSMPVPAHLLGDREGPGIAPAGKPRATGAAARCDR